MEPVLLEAGLSPEDMLTFDREHRFEWIDGRLKEKPPMGAEANRVATILIRLLDAYATASHLGFVFCFESGYKIFASDPKKTRKPDISFIARGRLPNDRPPRGHVTIPPDLEVEVVSPNDLAEEIDARVADYLAAGVKRIWIIYPATRSAWILRQDGTAVRLTETQELPGEDVLPGFSCPLRTLFVDL